MPQQPMFVGKPALVVVDIQRGADLPFETVGIAQMSGAAERIAAVESLVSAARDAQLPVIFFQEVHRRSGVDFGRELDGTEGVHYTFADAHQRDFHVRVVEDCVGGSSVAAHDAALNAMEYLQSGARRTSDDVISGLRELSVRLVGASA